MLANTVRASRSVLARAAFVSPKRTFVVSSARKADLVQEMYLKELKAYKVPPVKASDSEGNVQQWKVPATPKSPEEADIAKELQAYEASSVEVEGQAEAGAPAVSDEWFVEEEDDDVKAH